MNLKAYYTHLVFSLAPSFACIRGFCDAMSGYFSCAGGRFSGFPQLGHTIVLRSLNMEQYSHVSGSSELSKGRISVLASAVFKRI